MNSCHKKRTTAGSQRLNSTLKVPFEGAGSNPSGKAVRFEAYSCNRAGLFRRGRMEPGALS